MDAQINGATDPRIGKAAEFERASRWVGRAIAIWADTVERFGEESPEDNAAWERVVRAVDARKDAAEIDACRGAHRG